MSAMRRVRPVWAVVATASAVVVVASVVGSVATGMGYGVAERAWVQRYFAANGRFAPSYFAYGIGRGGFFYLDLPSGAASTLPTNDPFFVVTEWEPYPRSDGPFYETRHLTTPAWMPVLTLTDTKREVVVPFWTIGLVALIAFLIAWWPLRRQRVGHCTKCNYNLAGLRGDACPECGQAIASKGAAA